jgi:hypothetical protein
MLTRLRHVTFPDTNGVCDVAATFIAIARTAKQNQEFHRIDGCAGNGNGRGTFLQLGPSYNVKDIMLRDSRYIERYDKAVKIDNGSLVMVSNNMSGNEWDVWAGAGNSSVGYVREFFHIGEHSRHHAFVNMPYYAVGGTYDTQDMRPRSTVLPDPVYTRDLPDYRDYEECWILFGVHCPEATIEHTTISSMLNPAARVFGFMNNGAFSRVTIGPNYLGRNHTMSTLGLDEPSLQKLVGRPKVVFRDRATDVNLAGPGIQGLPSGEFTFNDRGVVYARNPDLTPMESTRIVVGDAPKAWNQIGRGETHFYRTDKQLMFRHVDADGRRKQGVVGAETVVTDQEKDGHS